MWLSTEDRSGPCEGSRAYENGGGMNRSHVKRRCVASSRPQAGLCEYCRYSRRGIIVREVHINRRSASLPVDLADAQLAENQAAAPVACPEYDYGSALSLLWCRFQT